MTIDNFDLFRNRLTFQEKTDRYIVHILCRPKDLPAERRVLGSNEHQRLLRTYYVDNLDYFNRKEEAIKTLCRQNHARAYILPQVRNNCECLLNLGEKVLETIRMNNFSVKPEHLLREAYCGYHKSRDKRWLLDLDSDNLTSYRYETHFGGAVLYRKEWTPDEVVALVRDNLKKIGKDPDGCYVVPTRSGCHVVTPPFDLKTAERTCPLMYQGVRKTPVEAHERMLGRDDPGYTGSPGLDRRLDHTYRDIVGWLVKDGMSLLYYDDMQEEEDASAS